MDRNEIYARSLWAQYHVQQIWEMVFTVIFLLTIVAVPFAWMLNHVYHLYTLGWMLDVVVVCLGLAMAGHSHNSLQVIEKIAEDLNKLSDHESFSYDLGKFNDPVRMWLTMPFKVVGSILALWALVRWPQL